MRFKQPPKKSTVYYAVVHWTATTLLNKYGLFFLHRRKHYDGTTHDMKVAPAFVDKIDLTDTDVLSADKGYDSKALREQIERTSTKANIPKKSNTLSNNHYMDWHLYKIRHFVENIFVRLKQFRGISTRYDKLKQNYENSVALACIFIWLPL